MTKPHLKMGVDPNPCKMQFRQWTNVSPMKVHYYTNTTVTNLYNYIRENIIIKGKPGKVK